MEERHDREQYFFDGPTVRRLADVVQRYEDPCCLCAPTVGEELVRRGVPVHILDLDERFAALPGFRRYDLLHPEWLGTAFGVILCDPPFFTVPLRRLAAALQMLGRNDPRQPLLVSYLTRREGAFLRALSAFELVPTGLRPAYRTVAPGAKNDIRLYGNLGARGNEPRLVPGEP